MISKIKQSGYGKYLHKIISQYKLENSVSFVGILPPNKYAERCQGLRYLFLRQLLKTTVLRYEKQ